ncbi:MAG: hypothetical protein JWN04_1449 [Myxococcaceae bacterium]|nr:hypothetical protein [Myxococcaceae bacterium]
MRLLRHDEPEHDARGVRCMRQAEYMTQEMARYLWTQERDGINGNRSAARNDLRRLGGSAVKLSFLSSVIVLNRARVHRVSVGDVKACLVRFCFIDTPRALHAICGDRQIG